MSAAPEGWQAVIGLEIHAQLATQSKIFSSAPVARAEEPNGDIDPVTLGLPGALPVLNREVVELAIRLGLAMECEIDRASRFDRKHYFYPDLPKGYQISQFASPICKGGVVRCRVDGVERVFPLTRIHLEEDAGKNVHDAIRGVSRVDFNRAGVPLVEIVGEPQLHSPDEAVAYMRAVHQVVVALGVCDGNMERGNFRCDANVSVRRAGETALGTRTEIKNLNSFRFVGRAITYEILRQVDVIESGGAIVQETRGWDDVAGVTKSQRGKEEAHDYRYFPDPDLMVVRIDESWVERVREGLPELPQQRFKRFVDDLGLSEYDADVLTQSAARADYFEAVATATGDAKLAANWVMGELLSQLNRQDADIESTPVDAAGLSELLALLQAKTISSKMAKDCFKVMMADGVTAAEWVAENGGQITDDGELRGIVTGVLDANPSQVAELLSGKDKLMGFFVGQVMRATKGKANPQQVNTIVKALMAERSPE